MPGRVQRAPHLGDVLLDAPRTDIDDPRNARELMQAWRKESRQRRTSGSSPQAAGADRVSRAPDGAGHPVVLTEFQSDWQKFAMTMQKLGVSP